MGIVKDIVRQALLGGGSGGSSGSGGGIIDDGKGRIYVTLSEGRTSPMVGVCPKGTVEVDWGDGTTPDVLTGTDTSVVQYTPKHEYAEPGDYVITLTVDGEVGFSGKSYRPYLLRNSTTDSDLVNNAYMYSIRNIQLPQNVTAIGDYAFQSVCEFENGLVIPGSVESIGEDAFSSSSVRDVVISDGVKSVNYGAFSSCTHMKSIVIPDSVTTLGRRVFASCGALTYLAIPPKVTNIPQSAFASALGMKVYDFTRHTAVPTLEATNAFQSIPADCEIRVRSSLLSAWKAATNWSTYASKIVAG